MPSVTPEGADDSPLDTLIGMGDMTLDTATMPVMDLGYVIPADTQNCGGPANMAFNAADIVGSGTAQAPENPGEGSIATDVAHGYSELLTAYQKLYGNPGTAESKGSKELWQDAVDAHADAITDGQPQSTIDALFEAIAPLKEAYDEDLAEFNAVSMGENGPGPVYQAGVNEWMAKAAVSDAIAAYNTKVTAANTARTDLNGLSYADHVVLRDVASQAGLFTDGNPNIGAIRTYANLGDGANAGVQDEAGTITGGTGNFDAAGNLLIPGSGGTADTPFTHVMASEGVTAIKTRLDAQVELVKNLKEARGDNQVVALDEVYAEAIRRAEVELGHFMGQWNAALSDETLQTVTGRDDDTATDDVDESMSSIKAEYATFQKADGERSTAETTLRNAVAAREAATEAVVNAFQSPESFYEQLVARRKALKMTADAAVTTASEDGGTPTEAQTKAASDAATALTAAQEAKAEVDAYLVDDEEDPIHKLVDTLLETDGDDGGALVDVLVDNARTADAAKTAADSAVEMVSGLTGDDGQVAQNTSAIAGHETRIAANEGEIWDADGNSRIDANETRSMENRTMIATNTTNIANNATNIAANRTDIDSNTGRITQNESDIMTNAGNIAGNREMIMTNMEGIEHNHTDIMGNRAMISSNEMSIMRNMEDIQTLKSGVAASMALAGMPEMGARGVSVGAGSYGGETALAVGVHFSGENARFKIGVTSSGGETGASLGAGWSF